MIHRQISLYWSSISLSNTIAALVVWSLSFWKKPISRRVKFARQLSKLYSEGAWYLFGSARSSITCFLKAVVKPEDEVIVSAYTCLAVPTAVVAAGAVPVYVDINSKTLAIDEHKIWCSITNKTKVIIVQHTLGNPAEVMKIREKAHKLGILILEDCALAIGTKINGCNVGTFGDAAIFSMELSKTLSSGWGGLLLVRNQSLIQEVENIYSSI